MIVVSRSTVPNGIDGNGGWGHNRWWLQLSLFLSLRFQPGDSILQGVFQGAIDESQFVAHLRIVIPPGVGQDLGDGGIEEGAARGAFGQPRDQSHRQGGYLHHRWPATGGASELRE